MKKKAPKRNNKHHFQRMYMMTGDTEVKLS